MSELETFRDHCRKMAKAEHRPECASLRPGPYWSAWAAGSLDQAGNIASLVWLGPKPEWQPAPCDCNLNDADRALFARLAGEVDAYLGDDEPLWGEQG